MFVAQINRFNGAVKVKKAKTSLALILKKFYGIFREAKTFLEKYYWNGFTLEENRGCDFSACSLRNPTDITLKAFKLNQSYCIHKAKQGPVEEIIHLEKNAQAYIQIYTLNIYLHTHVRCIKYIHIISHYTQSVV